MGRAPASDKAPACLRLGARGRRCKMRPASRRPARLPSQCTPIAPPAAGLDSFPTRATARCGASCAGPDWPRSSYLAAVWPAVRASGTACSWRRSRWSPAASTRLPGRSPSRPPTLRRRPSTRRWRRAALASAMCGWPAAVYRQGAPICRRPRRMRAAPPGAATGLPTAACPGRARRRLPTAPARPASAAAAATRPTPIFRSTVLRPAPAACRPAAVRLPAAAVRPARSARPAAAPPWPVVLGRRLAPARPTGPATGSWAAAAIWPAATRRVAATVRLARPAGRAGTAPSPVSPCCAATRFLAAPAPMPG